MLSCMVAWPRGTEPTLQLPHPATWLTTKPSKLQVKQVARAAVHEYWLDKLRAQADKLDSLYYLRTRYLGLTRCHPLFSSCGSSPWEVEKATTQARLLSGRYRVEALTGHWIPWNRGGLCSLPDCWSTPAAHKGNVESFLLTCPSLLTTRQELIQSTTSFLQANPNLQEIVTKCLDMDPVQFWLDCSTMSPVISAAQCDGDNLFLPIFKLTRNYCHRLHKQRCKLLEIHCSSL
jgi:hypothetical protein